MSALTGIRIVELAESVAGEYCGKLLADFGADVVKVERSPGGSPTRGMAPIIGDATGPTSAKSGLFAYLNTNKRSVLLDATVRGPPPARDHRHRRRGHRRSQRNLG